MSFCSRINSCFSFRCSLDRAASSVLPHCHGEESLFMSKGVCWPHNRPRHIKCSKGQNSTRLVVKLVQGSPEMSQQADHVSEENLGVRHHQTKQVVHPSICCLPGFFWKCRTPKLDGNFWVLSDMSVFGIQWQQTPQKDSFDLATPSYRNMWKAPLKNRRSSTCLSSAFKLHPNVFCLSSWWNIFGNISSCGRGLQF